MAGMPFQKSSQYTEKGRLVLQNCERSEHDFSITLDRLQPTFRKKMPHIFLSLA